jgi:1-deoxy-D-xylulose-5-phosphate reductoisomerase
MPTVLSAANEVAVYAFLKQEIRFTDIAKIVEKTLAKHKKIASPDLETIVEVDRWARGIAKEALCLSH